MELTEGSARLQLTTPAGEVLTGYALFERLTRALRLLWPVGLLTWLPGFGNLARGRYPSAKESVRPAAVPERERALVKG